MRNKDEGFGKTEIGSVVLSLKNYFLIVFGLLILYGTQFVFYDGKWPGNMPTRYLFPGILAYQFAILVGAVFFITALCGTLKISVWQKSILQVVVAISFMGMIARPLNTDRNASLQKVESTRIFNINYNILTGYMRVNQSVPLIFNSHSVWDYEAIVAVTRFIKASGLHNPVSVRMDGYSDSQYANGTLEKTLAQHMEAHFSNLPEVGAVPLTQVSKTVCVSVGLSGPFLSTCKQGVDNVWSIKCFLNAVGSL
jgi:hypothetical protein